jgi:hypothetical protein
MKTLPVKFIDTSNTVAEDYYPVPAKDAIPEWFKKAPSYINGVKQAYADDRGFTSATVKKCMPVFDAITAGYILYTPADLEITNVDGGKFFKWPDKDLVSFHDATQVPDHPQTSKNENPLPKWNNPWVVQTPEGYSSLFITPVHRPSVFQIFEGVVDTDSYLAAVQFPFMLKDLSWHGTIPAGTPMAQVIPFKRDSFQIEILRGQDIKDNALNRVHARLKSTFFNGYKDRFWHRKEFN